MIGLTFLIESAFIAFMGVRQRHRVRADPGAPADHGSVRQPGCTTFSVPWTQVLLIAGLAFGFALIMTLIPSRQAASIPIARSAALRVGAVTDRAVGTITHEDRVFRVGPLFAAQGGSAGQLRHRLPLRKRR